MSNDDGYMDSVRKDWSRPVSKPPSSLRATKELRRQIEAGRLPAEQVQDAASRLREQRRAEVVPVLVMLRLHSACIKPQISDFVKACTRDLLIDLADPKDFSAGRPGFSREQPPEEAELTPEVVGALRLLFDRRGSLAPRLTALERLVELNHSLLSGFVDSELRLDLVPARPSKACIGEPREWIHALIVAAEQIEISDPALRASIAVSLYHHAVRLHAEPTPPEKVLWSAIRRYGTLIEPTEENVGRFLDFLAPQSTPLTIQCALQSLANAFSPGPPVELKLQALRVKVVELCEKHICEEDGPPIGVAAYDAAAVLDLPQMGALAEKLEKEGDRWTARQIVPELKRKMDVWAEHAFPRDSSAFQRLQLALDAAERRVGRKP